MSSRSYETLWPFYFAYSQFSTVIVLIFFIIPTIGHIGHLKSTKQWGLLAPFVLCGLSEVTAFSIRLDMMISNREDSLVYNAAHFGASMIAPAFLQFGAYMVLYRLVNGSSKTSMFLAVALTLIAISCTIAAATLLTHAPELFIPSSPEIYNVHLVNCVFYFIGAILLMLCALSIAAERGENRPRHTLTGAMFFVGMMLGVRAIFHLVAVRNRERALSAYLYLFDCIPIFLSLIALSRGDLNPGRILSGAQGQVQEPAPAVVIPVVEAPQPPSTPPCAELPRPAECYIPLSRTPTAADSMRNDPPPRAEP